MGLLQKDKQKKADYKDWNKYLRYQYILNNAQFPKIKNNQENSMPSEQNKVPTIEAEDT